MDNGLLVKVLNINSDIQVYKNVKFIRILSEKYNLLIMRNYMPVIGEICGNIEIVGDETKKLENIQGYYMHKKDEFNLIVKEEL